MKEKIACSRIRLSNVLTTLLIIFAIGAYNIIQADVTDRGSYTTSITIDVPEFHDIAPNIRLVYDSNSGNGPLGIGWSLDAGSQITRTSEFQGVPRYDLTDQLWLDGMELIPCPPPSSGSQSSLLSVSCKNGGTHTTRVESFMRIKHDVSTNSWTIWQPDGTRLVYTPRFGDVSLLEKTFRWVLTEVVDTHSNRVTYNYICGASLTCYLSDISYGEGKVCTPRPSPSPDATPLPIGAPVPGANIHFYWEMSRPDPVSIAIGGALEEIGWRLRAIEVTEERERVRVYQINYLPELSGVLGYKRHQSWITSIQEFGSDAQLDPSGNGTVISGTPLPPYTFEAPAQLYSPLPSFLNTLSGNNQFTPVAIGQTSLPATYNGASVERFAPSQTLIPTYHPGRHVSVQASTQLSVALGDFDGDEKLDFMHWAMNSICNELKTRVITARDGPSLPAVSSFQLPQANRCITTSFSVDVDGDGRTDVLFLRYKRVEPFNRRNVTYETELISARSNGDGKFTFNNPVRLWTSDSEELALLSQCGVGDVNGDGRGDLACTIFPKGVLRIGQAISLGNGQFKIKDDYPIGQDGPTAQHTLSVADINGDGLSDLVVADQRPPSNSPKLDLKVGRSLGNGTFSWRRQPTNFNAPTRNQKARILIGDFNGDGRADPIVVIVNDNDVNGSFTFFSSKGGENATFTVTQQSVSGKVPAPSVGDFNGDGLDDLAFTVREARSTCNSTVPYDHQSFTYSLSRDGTLQIPVRFDTCYVPTTDWRWEGNWNYEAQATNVNGDLIADFFYYREWQDKFELYDRPGQDSADNRRPWRSTDVSGDGLADWVYVNYANPGLVVQTQITQSDGTRRSVRQDVASSGGQTPDLTHAAALSDWFLVDVGGGPNEAPDGKADVVIIDDVSQQIVTLIGNGDGTWRKIVTPTSMTWSHSLRGHSWKSPTNISNWHAIDVNGDTATDLVHIAFDQAASGSAKLVVRTFDFYYETTNGSSKWIPVGTSELTFGGYLRHPSVRGFYPSDINGDGRFDLVRLEHDPGLATSDNAVIWSLISLGDGTWDDRRDSVLLLNEASKLWFPMEVNGDGRTDFVYVMSKPDQPLLISSMISLGDGSWKDVQNQPVASPPIVNTEAVADFRIADVDGDGKQEFVHLSKTAPNQSATMVIWNRYPQFIQTTTTGLQSGSNNTRAWRLVDMNADDRPELVRILPDLNPNLEMISIPVWETRLTKAQNGIGARDEITYGTVVEQNRDMPLSMLPHVVKTVATRATDSSGPPDLQVNYTNSGATYSRQGRRFLGFKRVESNDSIRIVSSDFDLTYECGARRLTRELFDDQRRLIGSTKFVFAPTGITGPLVPVNIKAHTLCRVNAIQREEWERSSRPRLSEDRLKYDDYGNVIELLQTGDLADPEDDRKVESQFNFNVRDFLVNRIAEQTVSQTSGAGTWKQLARTRYEYDHSGNYQTAPGPIGELTRVRRWNDQTNDFVDTKYEYDKQGNVRVVTGPAIPSNSAGVSTTIDYDCEFNRFPEKICDSLFCTTLSWDKRLGQMKSTIDANGALTKFSYDALGRTILAEYPDKSFERWKWPTLNQWNTTTQAVTHELSDGSSPGGVLWDVTYFDGLGRMTRIESEGGISQEILKYDGISDRVREQTAPHFSQDQPVTMQSEYDAAGRLFFSQNPDSSTRRVQYDVGLYTTRNELGATTGYHVDAFGRITAVRENRRDCFEETCPIKETGVTNYYYDALDQLTRIIDAQKNETKVFWDSLGRQREACDPDRGCTLFKWNDDNTVKSVTDARKSTLSLTYDRSGRPLVQNSTDKSGRNTRTIRWTWDKDQKGNLQGASLGRVTQVEDDSKAAKLFSTYHYDDLGRVDRSNECIDGKCYEVETGFDLAGRTRRLTYPDQSGRITNSSPTVDYVYDNRGLLSSIPGYVTKFTHDAAGETTAIVFANGVEEARPYDSRRGWSDGVHIKLRVGNRYISLFDQTLFHDYVGRVREETIATRRGSHTDTFAHDDLGRLSLVTSNDPQRNRVFHYDLIANMTYHSVLGDLYYKDAAHVHAITGTSKGRDYKYDAVGQMMASAPKGLEILWNDEHRPKEMENKATGEITRFAYGRDGVRVKTQSNNGISLIPHSLVEVDPNGNVVTWIMAEGRRLARRTRNGLFFLHVDSLGSTRLVTDSSGTVVDESDYGTWGEEGNTRNASGNTYRFAGSRSDEQTRLSYMNARYYDSALAHFISPDSTIPNLYNPQSLNRYSYVLNDPVTLTDSSGYGPDCLTTSEPSSGPPLNMSSVLTVCVEPPEKVSPGEARDLLRFYEPENSGLLWRRGSSERQYIATNTTDAIAHGATGKILEIGGRLSVGLNYLGITDTDEDKFEENMLRWKLAGLDYEQSEVDAGEFIGETVAFWGLPGPKGAPPGRQVLHARIPSFFVRRLAKLGQEAHRQILKEKYPKWVHEVVLELIPGVIVRKDALRLTSKGAEVLIIKPNTASGIAAANRRAVLVEQAGYKPKIELYNPRDPKFQPGSNSYIGPGH